MNLQPHRRQANEFFPCEFILWREFAMMENGIVMAENQHSADAYKLLLDISRAANSQLELPAVLQAVAQCLDPRVRLDGIAVVSMDGDRLRPHWCLP